MLYRCCYNLLVTRPGRRGRPASGWGSNSRTRWKSSGLVVTRNHRKSPRCLVKFLIWSHQKSLEEGIKHSLGVITGLPKPPNNWRDTMKPRCPSGVCLVCQHLLTVGWVQWHPGRCQQPGRSQVARPGLVHCHTPPYKVHQLSLHFWGPSPASLGLHVSLTV